MQQIASLWTVNELVKATAGLFCLNRKDKKTEAVGVSIDSRTIKSGDVFIAIKGPNFDGHNFVRDAFAKGAFICIVNKDFCEDELEGVDYCLIKVEDTFAALQNIGKYARKRTNAKIIGITGSVAKTTTKEMLKICLKAHGNVFASSSNFNNHFGLPLSLANMPVDTDFGIFEMGMNHAGEIEELSKIASPDIAVITNIAPVHLEFFASVDEIAKAKAEIFTGLKKGGIVVLNHDNEYYEMLRLLAENCQKNIKLFSFSANENSDANAKLMAVEYTPSGLGVTSSIEGENYKFALFCHGKHMALNAVSALLVVNCLGLDMSKSLAAFKEFVPAKGRGVVHKLVYNDKTVRLIDETYNASPVSVKVLLDVLGQIKKSGQARRTIIVLGDMFELGDKAVELHKGLLSRINDNDIDKVFVAGKLMQHLYDDLASTKKGMAVTDVEAVDELANYLISYVQDGDVVAIKGSRGMKLERIVNAFMDVI